MAQYFPSNHPSLITSCSPLLVAWSSLFCCQSVSLQIQAKVTMRSQPTYPRKISLLTAKANPHHIKVHIKALKHKIHLNKVQTSMQLGAKTNSICFVSVALGHRKNSGRSTNSSIMMTLSSHHQWVLQQACRQMKYRWILKFLKFYTS